MLIANDNRHRAITEYGRQKLGSMLTPFPGSLIPIGMFQGYQGYINCCPVSIRLSFNQPSLPSRISLSASVSLYSSFLSHEDINCEDDWFGRHTFVFQKIRSIVYQECFPGIRMSQENLHFLLPIQFHSWLASPLDFPNILVSFRVLTVIFPF